MLDKAQAIPHLKAFYLENILDANKKTRLKTVYHVLQAFLFIIIYDLITVQKKGAALADKNYK